jgi:hypothetical protein
MGESTTSPTSALALTSNSTPTIRLDTTLADLYHEHGIPGAFTATTYCVFGHMDLDPAFPRELTYPEDEEPVPYSTNPAEITRLRKIIMGLKPLRRVVGFGPMDVLFFSPYATASNMERALSQLPVEQRHHPVYVNLGLGEEGVRSKLREVTRGRKLLYWRPQGWMREHDCLVDTEMAYEINSKKFLITSGIKTPASHMLELSGPDGTKTDLEESTLGKRELPFVVKLCLAGCGFGTWIVNTEARRSEMTEDIKKFQARGIKEVLVSDFIDWKRDLSSHFLIGAPGDVNDRTNPLIVGVTVQNLTNTGKWTGGGIDYSMQDELKALLQDTTRDTAMKMPIEYVGWAGVDVVVDGKGDQWVVDLNARFTGSSPICLMSNHFWKERGLKLAEFAAVTYGGEVDDIYELLQPYTGTGQVVVTATAAIGEGENMADVVWGGKDREELMAVGEAIKMKLGGTLGVEAE